MIQRGGRARLGLEPAQALGIVGDVRRQDLDGDVAPEPAVVRAVHLTHPARAEGGTEHVRPEAGAGAGRHGQSLWREYTGVSELSEPRNAHRFLLLTQPLGPFMAFTLHRGHHVLVKASGGVTVEGNLALVLEERILDADAVEVLPVRQILGQQNLAPLEPGGLDDGRIPV